MRLCSLLVLAALGCGGKPSPGHPTPPAAALAYPAARWIPAQPSYAIAARTVREAQQGFRDVADSFGILGDIDAATLAAELRSLLLVDPLSADAVANLGIDLDGGFALFSEGLNPTFVVHLSSPQQFQGFLEQQTQLQTQSVVVEGTEIFTTAASPWVRVSWAVADDWLWVHFALPIGPDDGTAWFTSSRNPGAPTWSADWAAAQGQGEPAIVGLVDPRGLLPQLAAKVPEAAACVRLLEPIGRVAISIDAGAQPAARLAFDVGASAAAITRASLPVPEGWAAASAQVPISAQWNLDLDAVRQTVEPCAQVLNVELARFGDVGIRAGRAFLRSFDPDDRSGTGAVSLDLAHQRFLAAQLEQIPLRSALERKRQFGPHAGRTLAVPMFLTIDYVLTDALALAAVGDGLLAAVVGKGASAPGPVFALDLQPQGLSREAWVALLELADVPRAKRVAERLLQWRAARVALTVDGSRLVLSASGSRR